jgi:hypothetical protein
LIWRKQKIQQTSVDALSLTGQRRRSRKPPASKYAAGESGWLEDRSHHRRCHQPEQHLDHLNHRHSPPKLEDLLSLLEVA